MINRHAFNRGVNDLLSLRHIRDQIDRLVSWVYIRRVWGERCSEVQPGCPSCDRWIEHDEIFNGIPSDRWGGPFVSVNIEDL